MAKKASHRIAWRISGAFFLAALAIFWQFRDHDGNAAISDLPIAAAGAHSFLMLRMPEISAQHEAGVDTMKSRVDQWLTAMTAAGYHPMRLSDALRGIEQYQGIPEKTVVIFFNPGYRRTYEIISPVFLRHRCPVVWLTNKNAMGLADRRYLTFHALRRMRSADGWEAGFADTSGHVRIDGNLMGTWSSTSGSLAINRHGESRSLNFLTVNANWTDSEFVERLQAENPASSTVSLTKALVQSREWGVTHSTDAADSEFSLQTTPVRRGLRLFWLGTAGQENFQLRAEIKDLVGELRLQLRYDEASSSAINLVFSRKSLLVENQQGGKFQQLKFFPQEESFQSRAFSFRVLMIGRRLFLGIDDQPAKTVELPMEPLADSGIVQIYLSDKLRGTAKIGAMRMLYGPLSDSAAAAVLFNRSADYRL